MEKSDMNAAKQPSRAYNRISVPTDMTGAPLARFAEALAPLGLGDMNPREHFPRPKSDRGSQEQYGIAAVAHPISVAIAVVAMHVAAVKYIFAAIL
jgi:hypothetical protein